MKSARWRSAVLLRTDLNTARLAQASEEAGSSGAYSLSAVHGVSGGGGGVDGVGVGGGGVNGVGVGGGGVIGVGVGGGGVNGVGVGGGGVSHVDVSRRRFVTRASSWRRMKDEIGHKAFEQRRTLKQ
eukprot:470920-Pleurochrysis_carterae.AAC.1